MKKLSLLLLLSVFVFCSCGDDDDDVKNEVVVSFENLLTEENSQFIAVPPTIRHSKKLISKILKT